MCTVYHGANFILHIPLYFLIETQNSFYWFVYLTITWGAAIRTPIVARIVNKLNVIKQRRSSTIAANFQSFSTEAASSSFRILLLITWISFRILTSSLWIPERAKFSNSGGAGTEDLQSGKGDTKQNCLCRQSCHWVRSMLVADNGLWCSNVNFRTQTYGNFKTYQYKMGFKCKLKPEKSTGAVFDFCKSEELCDWLIVILHL